MENFNKVKSEAEQGNIEAQLELGLLYARGNGVKKSYAIASKWFNKAALRGSTAAQN